VKLTEILTEAEQRPAVVRDCVALLDAEVASKGGVSGLAIKAGYKVVKTVKPGLIAEAFNDLLDDFAARLDPTYSAYLADGGKSFAAYAAPRAGEIAEALLGITDDRARRARNKTIKKTYDKLRPYGKKNVEQAVPGIGRLIDRYAPAAGA